MHHFCTGGVEKPAPSASRVADLLNLSLRLALQLAHARILYRTSSLSTSQTGDNTPGLTFPSRYRDVNICANLLMAVIRRRAGGLARRGGVGRGGAGFFFFNSTSSFCNQFSQHYGGEGRAPGHPCAVIDEQFLLSPTLLFALVCRVKWCVLVSQ